MSSPPEAGLGKSERQLLLDLARQAIRDAVMHGRLLEEIPEEGIFAQRRGVFVTLHKKGRLRGCIGVVEGHEPLGQGLVHAAASAALQDPRFPQVQREELRDLRLEISILSAMTPIRAEEVQVGRHGLLIIAGPNRGLLLPQVATEHGLTREQFLEETCLKAGLNREAWRHEQVMLFGFTCEIYVDDATGEF